MFVHTVYFWLKEQDNDEARQQLHEGLKELSTIAEIETAYVGTPASTRRPVIDHSYDFSITFVFADKTAQDVYQDHPDHHKFIDACSHLWDRVQIYDAVGE